MRRYIQAMGGTLEIASFSGIGEADAAERNRFGIAPPFRPHSAGQSAVHGAWRSGSIC